MTSETTDEAFERLVRRTLTEVAASTPIGEHVSEFGSKVSIGHRVMSMAAAGLLLVGGLGIAYAVSRQRDPQPPAQQPVETAQAPMVDFSTTLIPSTIPAGHVVYTGVVDGRRVERNEGVQWTFGRAGVTGDRLPAILVTIAPADGRFCPEGFGTPTLVGAISATLCPADPDDPQMPFSVFSWVTKEGVVVNAVAHTTVTVDELAAFASGLDSIAIARVVTGLDDTNAAPNRAPDGWILLGDDALLSTFGGHEVSYVVGPEESRGTVEYVQVRTWSGVPASAVYSIGFPLASKLTEVHGQPALLADREPDNPFLYWVEQDGTVVSVQSHGGSATSIVEFAEGLVTADQTAFDNFIDLAADPPFRLPRDERAETLAVDD